LQFGGADPATRGLSTRFRKLKTTTKNRPKQLKFKEISFEGGPLGMGRQGRGGGHEKKGGRPTPLNARVHTEVWGGAMNHNQKERWWLGESCLAATGQRQERGSAGQGERWGKPGWR